MVLKPEIQSSTMAAVNYLKRASSSFDEHVTSYEAEVHNSKKAREFKPTVMAITSRTPNNNNNYNNNHRKEKLIVTFSSKDDIFEITRPTKEEKNDMHMSKEDQRLILREISNAIRRFDRDEPQRDDNIHDDDSNNKCIEDLGLERIVEQQDSGRMKRVKSAICVILQRQRQSKLFQASENPTKKTINEGWLEKHYRPFSKISANLARNRGLRDQEVAPYLFPRKIVMSR